MVFGILKDIKEGENRVICTPIEVASIVAAGHTVLAQRDCGVGSGFSNEKYEAAGAEIVDTMDVDADQGFLASRKVDTIDSNETVSFKAVALNVCKPK